MARILSHSSAKTGCFVFGNDDLDGFEEAGDTFHWFCAEGTLLSGNLEAG